MMSEKYKAVAKNVDKLSDKTIDGMTDKEYKLIIAEIEKVIGK